MTLSYYERAAETFFADTVEIDMAPLRERFLSHLPPGAAILDAGCGSGRDARIFRERGYVVTAMEPAPALASLAEAYCRLPVQRLRFQEIDWQERFDGIWACASLLHVPMAELPEVFKRLARALRPEGLLYVSFKHGRGERERGGRWFTDLDEVGLAELLRQVPTLTAFATWITADQRPGRADECWLNAVIHNHCG